MLETILIVLLLGFAGLGLLVALFLAFAFFMHWYTTRGFNRE